MEAQVNHVPDAMAVGKRANVTGFVNVRLAGLRHGAARQLFTTGHPLDIERLLRRNVILQIEDVGDDGDRAFIMGALLIRLSEHLRARQQQPGTLRHLTVIEEAHRLLRRPHRDGPDAHAVNLFANLLAEVRAHGEGLIIADQIPANLLPDVIKNTAIKIVHRLPARADRDAVGATMNLTDEQSQHLVSVPPGVAALFTDGMDHPLLIQIPAPTPAATFKAAASAGSLISTSEPRFSPACRSGTCTVRDHETARRLLSDHPMLRIWADLTVLAHLLALPAPHPTSRLLADLHALPPAALELALGAAVTDSVSSRIPAISATHSPQALIAHVAADLGADKAGWRCPDPPQRWQAPAFRWNPVRAALTTAVRHNPAAGRHPDSDLWAQQHSRPVPGDTAQQQLTTVGGWCAYLAAQQPDITTLLLGQPPVLTNALNAVPSKPAWSQALDTALHSFRDRPDWVTGYLDSAYVRPSDTRL